MSFELEPAVAVRSSLADARGSIQFDYDNDASNSEKQDYETEKPPTPARRRSQTVNNNGIPSPILAHSKVKNDTELPSQSGYGAAEDSTPPQPIRKTSFATLPNTTTWQQQSVNYQPSESLSKLH